MTTETIQFNLLFDAATSQATTAINALNSQVTKLETGVKTRTAGIRNAFSSIGGNALNGAKTGFTSLGQSIAGATTQLGTLTAGMSPVGPGLLSIGAAGGAAVAGVAALGAAMVAGGFAAGQYADQIDDTANAIDVSNRFYQEQSALVVRAGGDAAAFEKSMGKLNIKLGEAAQGNEAANAAFAALGVSVRDAAGNVKDNEDVFNESRAALANVSNDAERAALAQDLFGKGAKDMNGILKMSAAEYAALGSEVQKYGIATDENIAKAGKLGDGMDAVGQALRAGVINAFAGVAEKMGEFAMNIAPLVGQAFSAIGAAMDVLGAVGMMLGDGLKALWSLISDGAGFIANLIPGFDNLSAWMGKVGSDSRSLRDRFIDSLQGMLTGAGSITGSIAAMFARMSARIQNSVADIRNGISRSGMGRFFGISGETAKVDVNAAGEAARGRAEAFAGVAARSLNRYRAGPGEAGDDRRNNGSVTRRGGAGGGGGADSAAKAAADATKKYEDALEKLKQAQNEAAYSEEQKAIADALSAAGLPRLIAATDERTTAIRNQVLATREAEAAARADRSIENLAEKMRDATLSAEDLARVEARRAAGVSDNLAVTNEYIARLDAQAVATYRAADAALKMKANEQVLLDLTRTRMDVDFERRELAGDDVVQIDYEREIAGIEAATAAMRERIIESTKEGELREQQLRQLRELEKQQKKNAEAAKKQAEANKTKENVDTLADFLVDMWERPREAFAQFLKDVLIGFAKMALANVFNGNGVSGGRGIGNMFMDAIGGAIGLKGQWGGFGGFKAAGGPVVGGQGHIVGENGREYFRPHTDGDIIPVSALGGGTTTNSFDMPFNYYAAPGGSGQTDMHEAASMERFIRGHIKAALDAAGIRS